MKVNTVLYMIRSKNVTKQLRKKSSSPIVDNNSPCTRCFRTVFTHGSITAEVTSFQIFPPSWIELIFFPGSWEHRSKQRIANFKGSYHQKRNRLNGYIHCPWLILFMLPLTSSALTSSSFLSSLQFKPFFPQTFPHLPSFLHSYLPSFLQSFLSSILPFFLELPLPLPPFTLPCSFISFHGPIHWAIPENIHTYTTDSFWDFQRGGGFTIMEFWGHGGGILDKINGTSGPPLSPFQWCQNSMFLLLHAFIIGLGGMGDNCSISHCPRLSKKDTGVTRSYVCYADHIWSVVARSITKGREHERK